MTDEPGFGKETHSTYEPLPEEIAARRVTDPPIQWESHEGMVTVYREDGTYAGCMGAERWERLLREDKARSVTDPAAVTPDVDALVQRLRTHIETDGLVVPPDDALALSDLAATARERDKAVRVAEEHAEAAMAAEQTNAELEAALARVANYLVACRDERHGTPGGDNCARCRSDNREIAALGLQKWWDGEKYVLRASGSCPGCGHDRHSPGYCVMLSGESATGTCQCQWQDISPYDRDRLARRVAELEDERDYANGIASSNATEAAALRSRVAGLEDALRKAEDDFDLIRRTIRNSKSAPNVWESLNDFAKWGKEDTRAALAGDGGGA